jgi:hypothetical protein
MTPAEFKIFCNENRAGFFAKFPKPGTGPRGFWRDISRHADNACEDNDWSHKTFDDATERIRGWLREKV